MANNKDFLSQFSGENEKPESFQEEVRIPVAKNSGPIKPIYIIIPVISLLIVGAILAFIFLLPHISVENFVGMTKADVQAWISQQEIEKTGIIFKDEYNFDNEKGVIISQEPADGKVKKDAKMTFIVSAGPDPDEKINVPELKIMERSDIDAWIKSNKLQGTKITTQYDDEIEEGFVIKIEPTNFDADAFTRGSTLRIYISKGKKPVEQVTVKDFVKQTYASMETWANENKLKLTKTEVYSDTIDLGLITYQSVSSGTKVDQGSEIKVNVSKGKAVKMIDLTTLSSDEAMKWLSKNGISYSSNSYYSYDDVGTIIDFSPAVGTILNGRDDVTITTSLGSRINLSSITPGISNDNLKSILNEYNNKGADLTREKNSENVYSYTHKFNYVMSVTCKIGDSDTPCDLNNAPINAKIVYTVSKGMIYKLNITTDDIDGTDFRLVKLSDKLTSLGLQFSVTKEGEIALDDKCELWIDGVKQGIPTPIVVDEIDTYPAIEIKEDSTIELKVN